MKKIEIKSLNAVRLVFCFWVVIIHYYNIYFFQRYFSEGIVKNIFEEFIALGFFPVSFFFTLSGFLISYNYCEKNKNLNLYTFIRNRLKKLYPLVFMSVIVEFILICVYAMFKVSHFKPLSIYSLVTSCLLVRNGWFHEVGYNAYGSGTWFINVLFLCYIIWFVISTKLDYKKYVILCLSIVAIGYFFMQKNIGFPFLYHNSCRGYISFFAGCILYEVYSRLKEKQGVWLARILLVCNVLILFLWFYKRECVRSGYLVFSLFVVPSIILMAIYIKPFVKVLNFSVCNKASKYTMSIYLTHTLVFETIILLDQVNNWNIDFSKMHVIVILFSIVIIFSIFVSKYVEKKLALLFEEILMKIENRWKCLVKIQENKHKKIYNERDVILCPRKNSIKSS